MYTAWQNFQKSLHLQLKQVLSTSNLEKFNCSQKKWQLKKKTLASVYSMSELRKKNMDNLYSTSKALVKD